MGIFDLFGREQKTVKSDRTEFSPAFGVAEQKESPVAVFKPTSFEDVEKIIDVMKSKRTAVVHLTDLKAETAIRALDLLSGAVYALDGGVYEMQKNIFMFSPNGVEVR